jgi:nicotinate-nucleotide pyrophosphorylase (carboxylating)
MSTEGGAIADRQADVTSALVALVDAALAEDVGPGDWTTLWTVEPEARGRARIVAKGPLIVAGTAAVHEVFRRVDSSIVVESLVRDGSRMGVEEVAFRLEGPLQGLLTGERVALNFLGRLSGVATLTRRFVDAVEGTGTRIVDTRKTTPGWRLVEKAAVRAGGGHNHRVGLYDMVMVKDNHVAATGGVTAAVERIRARNAAGLPVEVEVSTMAQLDEALLLEVDRLLLDNMAPAMLRAAVERVRAFPGRQPELEASGNVNLDSVRPVADTGVDLISVGALTHSAPAADFSMRVDP